MDYQKILKGIHQEIEPYATIGKQALSSTYKCNFLGADNKQ